jgi:predicted nucleic acid-binding protein
MTPSLVIDASVSGSWCFPEEASTLSEAVLEAVTRAGAVVPALWMFEMTNVLGVGERRGRIGAEAAAVIREALADLPILLDGTRTLRSISELMDLAREFDLTAYDASYLELAIRTGSTLATRDVALMRAATRAGVPLFSA